MSSGKINNQLLCELATHENFQRLMTDIEFFVDRIADMWIAQMKLVLEATRQGVIRSHVPEDNDLYVRTLELGQVQESDFSVTQSMMIWTVSFRIFVRPMPPTALPLNHSRLYGGQRKV